MRILILDDDFLRHQAFRRIYTEDTVICVQRFSDFVAELENGRGKADWDIIHLDHDLGDHEDPQHSANSYLDGWGIKRAYDGVDAVNQIISQEVPVGKVIVHSVNNVGAPRMVADLIRFGYEAVQEPFGEVSL